MYNQKMWRDMEELIKKFESITITGGKETDARQKSPRPATMDATQNQRVVRPKRRNTEAQKNTDLDGSGRDTGGFAGTLHHQGQSSLKPEEGGGKYDLMEDNAALKAQLEDSHVQQKLFYCKWAAVQRKNKYLTAALEEISNKHKYYTAGAEATIEELKGKLQRSRNTDIRSHEAEIQKLKFELSEARVERINAVNRLILSDKIMARLSLKLGEANEKLAQLQRQQEENAETVAALRRAEEEKDCLQRTLRKKQEEWTQMETAMKTRLDELESRVTKACEKKSKKGWLGSLLN